jgi:hypothetical protein
VILEIKARGISQGVKTFFVARRVSEGEKKQIHFEQKNAKDANKQANAIEQDLKRKVVL